MKYIVLFLLTSLCLLSQENKELLIGGERYIVVHESYNEYGDKGVEMKLYKKSQSLDELPLFSFTLENRSGGCGERSTQDGNYEINGTTLTLYSHWDRSGRAYDAPRGDRIQQYTIETNGTVAFKDGVLYIERQAKNYDKESGLKYLFTSPKNDVEKEKLHSYIESTERLFGGKFVYGDEAVQLHEKVDIVLMKKRQIRWK